MDNILYPGTIIATGLCVFFGLLGFVGIYHMVDQDNREYMDPLPWKLRMIWPFIQIIANFFCVFLPYDFIEHTEFRLSRTGVSYLMTGVLVIRLLKLILLKKLLPFVRNLQ